MTAIRTIIIALVFLPALALITSLAQAVTPPTPTAQTPATVVFKWDMPTTRADGTPLPLSEIAKINLYVTSLASVISVNAPATQYTYILPAGVCMHATDATQATAVDTNGQESVASLKAFLPADVCGPKPLPSPPGNVTVSGAG